ncbi:O-methyltransferase [Agromyces luteolus]|uniref:Methyltransferase n=1 Tax=Agromyces luteolus TaxID=88373 RepID=A0A7C9LEN3_9MICO|nr:O-methyltransferase [Agromyces luteolus]MUN08151.1 methyltransferase [Agromyces luteolus]GLK29617.1 O-methyltransferase [Agromyces luteolus]
MADPTLANWRRVDDYLAATLLDDDPALTAARRDSLAAGLPAIEVTPLAGRLLELLARMTGARRVLEIGTLGGYSTIHLARGIRPDGLVVTLELEQRHADVARANLDRADVAGRVEIIVGRAADTLPHLAERLAERGRAELGRADDAADPFDLVFIDADKESNALYLDWAIRLGRPGTVIVVDNIGRAGEVADPGNVDPMVVGTRRGLELLGSDPRVDATALQTVGAKGWDGFAIGLVR